MPDTTSLTAWFPSLEAARSARRRLVRAGFARNSIDLERVQDEFEVTISTREENRQRAEDALHGRFAIQDVRRAGETLRDFASDNRGVILGMAALAGLALFLLTNRS